MVYYMLSLLMLSCIIFSLLLISFLKKINLTKKYSPKFWFFLFMCSILLFLIFRVIFILYGPDADLSFTSKFSGTQDYINLLIIGIISNFFLNLGIIFFIFTGLSFRGIRKIDYFIALLLLILYFIFTIITNIESIEYSEFTGWSYKLNTIVNLYNYLLLIIIIYYIIVLIKQKNKIKNKEILYKFNSFIIGASILLFGGMFSFIIIQKFFGQWGFEIVSLDIGIIFISKAFR